MMTVTPRALPPIRGVGLMSDDPAMTAMLGAEQMVACAGSVDGRVLPLSVGTGEGVATAGQGRADSGGVKQSTARPAVYQEMMGHMDTPRRRHDDLAVAAGAGDTAALDELLVLIDADGSIQIPVRKLIANAQTVQDVCQDVLIVVAEQVGTWEGRGTFQGWVATVARNKAIDHLRAKRPTEQLVDLVSDQQRVSSMIATRVEVNRALEDLPDHYRQPVVLRDIEQLDYDEIARMLDVEYDQVKLRVSRGRAMVAARWARSNR